ncbi:TPA: hypothetical protein DDZ01_02910 [Candidatus Uhrbacteria bacterium]|nr:hypothetical protein [Candidatus Uhrbacteria bacterium]HCB55530.1 hypothetical protein [Candidatus Uhrbacteria bacterium]
MLPKKVSERRANLAENGLLVNGSKKKRVDIYSHEQRERKKGEKSHVFASIPPQIQRTEGNN